MECYLDNSATTRPSDSAVAASARAMTEVWGNPSALHRIGDEANALLESSRKTAAKFLRAGSSEVYFTGCGTDSNNLAIFGTVRALRRRGNRIVTTAVEHPSVEEPMKRLEEDGYDVVRLPVDGNGCVDPDDLAKAVTKDTILVSMMLVNNEVGSIMPLSAARTAIRRAKAPALLHCDGVQGFGKLPVTPKELGVDLLSASAHKIHGPKGVGLLYVKSGTRILPYLLGGGQEGGLRSGTEGMPAIAGFAAAIGDLGDFGTVEKNLQRVTGLRDSLLQQLNGIDYTVNSPENALPYILNLSIPGIPSEVLRNSLSEKGVYVSTGSACSKGHRSTVLTQMGIAPERIDSAIRISFSATTT
ncbi:MAG: cysteine desulfurase, partial [Clostridia bacterium]|nr:cysteine desulfurase [Clostridia bacterium]